MRITTGVIVAAMMLGIMGARQARAADDEKPIRALFICGGCCHDYAHQKDILTQAISKRANVVWTIAYDPDTTNGHQNPVYDNPDWAKGFDIIFHDECSSNVNDLDVVNRILKPHQEGLPAVVLHCGMHSYRTPDYPKNTPWFEFTGLNTNHHGPQLPIRVTIIDPDNPIAKGLENWTTIQEELYHEESLAKTADAIMVGKQKSRNYDDTNVVVWTNNYHGTRVFCTTLGHNNQTVGDPRYVELITRGMLWALNKLDDAHLKPVAKTDPAPDAAQKAAATAGPNRTQVPVAAPQPVSTTQQQQPQARRRAQPVLDAEHIRAALKPPPGFDLSVYGTPPQIHYPTAIAATPGGELFVAIDEDGSLGKEPNRGRIFKCVDSKGDGKADKITLFATMDHPRGLVWDDGVLYVLHPPFLSAYYDDNGDGVADRSEVLVRGISNEKMVASRGADHTTNGIRLGIDGWIYIAMGDFGAVHAISKDGSDVQLRGGGVVRIRPDGTGLERYSWGQRNIYDVAIDPLMNIYTRDNTNDGDNWNDRLSYIVPTANYGYPSLFMNFKGEFVDALADYGGGAPCGSLFIDEPNLPGGLYTVEWGRSEVDHHPLTADGANFKVGIQKLMDLPRGTDIDVDGIGHIYLSSWANGGFSYSGPDVGYVIRLTPRGLKPATFPDLHQATDEQLLGYLASASAVCRQATQRQILRRGDKPVFDVGLVKLAQSDKPLSARAAAIFTLKLLRGSKADAVLAELAGRAELTDLALRALADRKGDNDVPSGPFLAALRSSNPRVRLIAAWGLGRLGRADEAQAIVPLLADSDPLVAHIAIRSLTFLHAYDACLKAVDPSTPQLIGGALQVLQSLHETQVVDGLSDRLAKIPDPSIRGQIFGALSRLYYREADWDGSWWSTRPDTSGPYYKTAEWPGTENIKHLLHAALSSEKPQVIRELIVSLQKNKVDFPEAADVATRLAATDPAFRASMVDLLSNRLMLSSAQISFMASVANSDKESPALRAKAIGGLQKNSGAPAAGEALVDALSKVVSMEKPDADLTAALNEFIRDPRNGRNTAKFAALAESDSPARRELGYSVLLNLATQRLGRANFRSNVPQIIDRAWEKPELTVSLLRAIARNRTDGYRERIKTLQGEKNPQVAHAATDAAHALGLARSDAAPTGPFIESLSYESVASEGAKIKGDPKLGAELFTKAGCVVCHTTSTKEAPTGPLLAGISARYSRPELIESILKPSAKIAQGFETQVFKTSSNEVLEGFVTRESGDELELRNATGVATVLKKSDIKARGKRDYSIMPEGLAAKMSVRDLANLLAYLESLKTE